MTSKTFASRADLAPKKATSTQLSEHAYAYTAEGDPNTVVVIGEGAALAVDTTATPVMAKQLIAEIRRITDKPIKSVVLSRYHAVRVLGASACRVERVQEVIASGGTYALIFERGEQDMKSEIGRFPQLFDVVESVPGLTRTTLVFERKLTLFLGKLEVQLKQFGIGQTQCDTIVWLPQGKVLLSGDLVEHGRQPTQGRPACAVAGDAGGVAAAWGGKACSRPRAVPVDERGRQSGDRLHQVLRPNALLGRPGKRGGRS